MRLLPAALACLRSTTLSAAAARRPLPTAPSLPKPDESAVIDIGRARIFFAKFGSGPDVLLLHGGLGNSSFWGYQVPALASHYTVTVMDTRGHGRSTDVSGVFGYDHFADDVLALIDRLSISRTAVVGWSDGAITGLALAARRAPGISKVFAFGANATVAGLIPGGSRGGAFPAYVDQCRTQYRAMAPHPEHWDSLVSSLGAMWRREPNFTASQLGTITIPVAICVGSDDEIIRPEHSEWIAAAIPGASSIKLPRLSHFAPVEAPADFNAALLTFLQG